MEKISAPQLPQLADNTESLSKQYEGLAEARYVDGSPEESSLFRYVFFVLSKKGLSNRRYDYWTNDRNIERMCTRFLCNRSPEIAFAHNYRSANGVPPTSLIDSVIKVVKAIITAYVDANCPEFAYKAYNVDTVEEFLAIVDGTPMSREFQAWGLPFDREELAQFYTDVKDRKEPKSPFQAPSAGNTLLKIPLTGDLCLQEPEFPLDHFTVKELEGILGEKIPDLGQDGIYCVRSHSAYKLLYKGKKEFLYKVKGKKPLTEEQKDAVLKELWLNQVSRAYGV
ncbi:hypothetical protein CKM354_001004000 [Cercospora kikuchii]|uniref:Uncharacterized protein n=1 Tax=Cercospora kikuchii TaxID=84275 RepID=A0A9P3FJI0_9PEZI|nr:uncharacterized protein CKM354_001004000 [Cercospora kikuchii]GIZ46937.1 hypothetical protein CKM354_001004000 [Cercospora kikuchii]